MVGLKLSVVDEEGRRWTLDDALEFDVVGVVGRGGRRFPATTPPARFDPSPLHG
jgi:hypothetical protein